MSRANAIKSLFPLKTTIRTFLTLKQPQELSKALLSLSNNYYFIIKPFQVKSIQIIYSQFLKMFKKDFFLCVKHVQLKTLTIIFSDNNN